jgi:uncharacterized protein
MATAAGGLRELHQLHVKLEAAREKLAEGPKRIQSRRRRVERLEKEIAEGRERAKQMKVAADQKSLQLKTNEAKIADLRGKLNAATTNREFDIIKSQIDADTMANSVLEDEILEAYEKIDQFEAQIAETQRQRDAALAEEKQAKADAESQAPALRAEVEKLEKALKTAEAELPATVATVYQRLVAAHGATALAELDGISCSSCHATIAPNMRVELNVGKIVFCRSCGRLLYKAD